jgi:hypothetical protein
VNPGFISDEQARKALDRAHAEGRVQLSPEEVERMRAEEKRHASLWNQIRRLFPRSLRHNS